MSLPPSEAKKLAYNIDWLIRARIGNDTQSADEALLELEKRLGALDELLTPVKNKQRKT